jgi:hypothetical protein
MGLIPKKTTMWYQNKMSAPVQNIFQSNFATFADPVTKR